MKPSELKKYLRKEGIKIIEERHGAKHDMWIADNGKFSRIPRHAKEINPNTLRDILDDFGLTGK